MTEMLLFHHALGLTDGVRRFADQLRSHGHVVHVPDLYDGRRFDDLRTGVAYAENEIGFDNILLRAGQLADGLPDELVYGGFSLGVLAAQQLAQTRSGARGALLFHGAIPASEFGDGWPDGVPLQIHLMDADELVVQEGDLDAARDLVRLSPLAELFLYRGDRHLFADSSLPDYDPAAAKLLTERVLAFLEARSALGSA